MFRAVFFCLTALYSNVGLAQCLAFDGTSWPTVIRFEPAQPVAGQPVTMVLGPMASVAVDFPVLSVSPDSIDLTGRYIDGLLFGVPLELRQVSVPLGPLTAGQYTVRVRLTLDDEFCPDVTTTLIVRGTTPASVPAISRGTQVLLIFILAILAAGYRKRLIPRPHPSMRSH